MPSCIPQSACRLILAPDPHMCLSTNSSTPELDSRSGQSYTSCWCSSPKSPLLYAGSRPLGSRQCAATGLRQLRIMRKGAYFLFERFWFNIFPVGDNPSCYHKKKVHSF
jgi:hypothetical protein